MRIYVIISMRGIKDVNQIKENKINESVKTPTHVTEPVAFVKRV